MLNESRGITLLQSIPTGHVGPRKPLISLTIGTWCTAVVNKFKYWKSIIRWRRRCNRESGSSRVQFT